VPNGLGRERLAGMTDRNFKKELNYYVYNDPEYSEDIETIDYDCLIGIITELVDRIEKLENWQAKAQKSATIVKKALDAKND
jgi:hypothetical protein